MDAFSDDDSNVGKELFDNNMNPIPLQMNASALQSCTEESDDHGGSSSSQIMKFSSSFPSLSLDAAVSPVIPRPIAPFASRSERKRAHVSALYYSECFLRGIEPTIADKAAMNAQWKYDKWWINTAARTQQQQLQSRHNHPHPKRNTHAPSLDHTNRKRRKGVRGAEEEDEEVASTVSANIVSVDSRNSSQRLTLRNTTDEERASIAFSEIATLDATTKSHIQSIKQRLMSDLKASGGNVQTPSFLSYLEVLEAYYRSKSWDGRGSCRNTPFSLEGNWLTLSKPTYNECKGQTTKGEYLYTIGRMSFDMFKAVFNHVRPIDPKNPDRPLHVPKKLMKETRKGDVNLRTYDIVVAFTIEPGQDRKGNRNCHNKDSAEYIVPTPIRGILTNHGYAVPDPRVPNRMSIWFSGGSLEVQDEPRDLDEWVRIFDATSAPGRDLREYANILAARLLLGALLPEDMEDDGTMSFVLKRPIGGHGSAYCDIIYMDDDLRIMRGHHGSVYVCKRVPEPDHIICD